MKRSTPRARLSRRAWIIIGSCAVAVLGASAAAVLLFWPSADATEQTVTTTATASLETLEQSVSASGTLTPSVNETVSFSVSGTIVSVSVGEGDEVEEGDALAEVDTLSLDAALLQAEADLADAEAQLSSARSDGTSSRIAAAEAAVEVAESARDSADDALDDAVLRAPADGIVTSVGYEVGDVVGSSSSGGATMSATTATTTTTATDAGITIVGTDSWTVEVTVGEVDVDLIEVDQQVELTTSDGTELFGLVTEVGLLPSTSSGSAAYPVTVAVTGTAEGLFDGIDVDVSLIYERRTGVLTVPSAAVSTVDGVSTVTLVADDGTETETEVEVGDSSGTLTEIISGLTEGDTVVVASFTPGEGNQGGGFPDGFPEGGFPEGGFPEGGFPEGGFPEGGFPGGTP